MRIVNYKRGYSLSFDCVIHGTIKMSKEEFDKVVEYLYANADEIRERYTYFQVDLLKDDLAKRIFKKDNSDNIKGFFVNVRVGATEAIVGHFKPRGTYRRGNYQLYIDDHTAVDEPKPKIDLLTNLEKDIVGNWYQPREWIQAQKGLGVVDCEYYNTTSSSGDWDGWFVQKVGGTYYLIGFSQENNWPISGFTLNTGEILATSNTPFEEEDIWDIYQNSF